MTRRENGARNGSELSNQSWRSQDTVRRPYRGVLRGPPVHIETDNESHFEPRVTAGSGAPVLPPFRFNSSSPSAKNLEMTGNFGNYRRDLSVLETSGGGNVQSISRHPPMAGAPNVYIAPWASSSTAVPSSAFPGTFFNDSTENLQVSPSFRPGTGRTGISDSPDVAYYGDERRPSATSATTVSSQGSRSSSSRAGLHRKLTELFGEDYAGYDAHPHGSQTSLVINGGREVATPPQRDRNNSVHTINTDGRPASPVTSRPRTPLPSSDVVPWVFQDPQDISHYGDAPVRQVPTGPDKQRYTENESHAPGTSSSNGSHHSHRLHFPGHRHTRSKDDPSKQVKDSTRSRPVKPAVTREDSQASLRRLQESIPIVAPMTSRTAFSHRSSSPTPSSNSGMSREAPATQQRSPVSSNSAGKRSLLDKLRRHKGDRGPPDSLQSLPGSTRSLQDPVGRATKVARTEESPRKRSRDGSVATFDSNATAKPSDFVQLDSPTSQKKEQGKASHGHKFRSTKRGASYENNNDRGRNGSVTQEALWDLDTDLSHMEGILSQPPPSTPPAGGIFMGDPVDEENRKELKEASAAAGPGAWDAPDSWAVKKVVDENMGRLREIDEAGIPQLDDTNSTPHCVRIFRVDSTFATISANVNTTVTEILQILGKKSFLQDELNNYQIVMQKHDLQRQLQAGERPIAIQKKLLIQAGYTEADRIEEVGREDNSYLCRFRFVPTKISKYYGLDKDPGLSKLQKFSHIDLQGRSLVTIPIPLYQKAAEIISLNLSRNLSLDVPTDFIQGCINLRELRFISNEMWHLPPSLSLASRLTVLDISNNRLEQLDHAELDKLQSLVSIKMANNKLTHLPPYFGQFKFLRSLNVSSNFLKDFPDFLCDLKSLVDLDVSFNSIGALPKIGQLSTLERLWATNNMLSGSFPDNSRGLVSLKEIDVRFNGIASIDIIAQLPRLEQLMIGHNAISVFEGFFSKARTLQLDHNPITRFHFTAPVPTLTTLNLASAKLAQLEDSLFEKTPSLAKLTLDKNHFVNLSSQIGKLRKLEHLSVAKNPLVSLPATVGCLTELRFLDVRECNLKKLPVEIWCCHRLDTLNISSNVLESCPTPGASLQAPNPDGQGNTIAGSLAAAPGLSSSPSYEELGKLEGFGARRPSQASGGLLSVGSSPAGSTRKGSIVSIYGPGGRKASVISRTATAGPIVPYSRKDSSYSQRIETTFAGSLRHLYLADNRLNDDVFDEMALLPELRVLNLSYNELYDIPQRSIRRWPHLAELYLSGNELTSLPSDDLEEVGSLKVLHLNGNKFQVLPAELGKVQKLAILDVGSNSLKYNVSNWPYDWNWNYNRNLKSLNFSGNKRLEIKPSSSFNSNGGREETDLTNFNNLHRLRVLGLMDVTLTIPSVPEQTEDRRVRTSGSSAGHLAYGMADSLGRHEHLSTIDMVVPRFRGHDTESLLGMFDGHALSSGGSKVAKFLHENFSANFIEELSKLKKPAESPTDALRRTFLALNKDLAATASQSPDDKERQPQFAHRGSFSTQILSQDDLNSGGVATVLYLDNMELYVANVGDAQAMLMHSDGGFKIITRKHDPAEPRERQRIREAGGYVSRQGKLNDVLDVSRAFGYIQMMPAVMAAPHVLQITLRENDEMILIASRELWDYLTPDVVVDVARSERGDLMRAAQKLRDLAIAFGATGKIMVMMIGVSDLKKRERNRYRGQSLSMGPSAMHDDDAFPVKRGKRPRDGPDDSTLARLDQEVDAPTGYVSIIFTDIKNSTVLWETFPVAMRSAIKIHNSVMRRQLRIIGGYEVKTEGDAFMVSFPTATSALLWCFSVQSHLLEAAWPSEILSSVHGQEVLDSDQNVIFRGLSVRMGIHWGNPVCEPDPVTRRMDYFGPMVNRAARISAVADGGQITVSSDFIAEIHRALETYAESDRTGSTASDEILDDDMMGHAIRRELRALSTQGFEVKDLGERKLKGLENPEYVYLMYPHSLAGRLVAQQQRADAEAAAASNDPASMSKNSQLNIDTQPVWDLWNISLRLEMLCSALESSGSTALKPPETAMLERVKNRGGEVTDRFLLNFIEHQVSRIETCISALALRHMVRPFVPEANILEQACPMGDIFEELTSQLAELQALKAQQDFVLPGA